MTSDSDHTTAVDAPADQPQPRPVSRDELNDRAARFAKRMLAEDDRLTGNPHGAYAARLLDVLQSRSPELAETFIMDLEDRREFFQAQLDEQPPADARADLEINSRAGVYLMLNAIDETVASLRRVFPAA